jgi:tetratricopeptide (TPR) repeat protein
VPSPSAPRVAPPRPAPALASPLLPAAAPARSAHAGRGAGRIPRGSGSGSPPVAAPARPGSSFYAIKDFPSAISAQQTLIERFPDSPRIPEALLNIAASQVELNDRKSARATLNRIVNDYPDSEAAKLAHDRLAGMPKDKK